MTSFYFDRYATADESTWDPHNIRAVSKYATPADLWLEDNADLDPDHKPGGVVILGTSDEERLALLKKLNYKETQTFDDIQSGASAITGDGQSSGASSLRSETSEGNAMGRTTDLKMRLALANNALAERDAVLAWLQEQISQLMAQQGLHPAPDHSEHTESGSSPKQMDEESPPY